MRTVADIDADINEAAIKLAALRRERAECLKIWRQRFIDVFDEGRLSIAEIAEQTGTRFSVVQAILYRSGRTQAGRALIHEQFVHSVSP